MQSLAALKHAAQITNKKLCLSQEWRGQATCSTYSTPSLQALTGKHVVASLLGHSRLVAQCSLVISQEGQ